MKSITIPVILFMLTAALAGAAQTSEFTYQGTLNLSGSPASGNYDFEFRLFDAANGGTQIGPAATRTAVPVASGAFSVSLAFAGAFPGADRWMEISVRPSGSGGGYQQLLPRVKVNSVPYSIKSQSADTAATANNALSLGSVAANQFVQTTDARLSDSRNPTPGSSSYIQNTSTQQAASNFNISGDGRIGGHLIANKVLTDSTFYIGGWPVIRAPNVTNTFINPGTVDLPTFGNGNTIVGYDAGMSLESSSWNSFFGPSAGTWTTTGQRNTFLGYLAGTGNTSGSNNTALGTAAGISGNPLQFATALGAGTIANSSNSIFLGRPGGEDTVRIPGNLNLTGAASINGNLVVAAGNLAVFNGNVVIPTLGSAGATALCRNASNIVATCSSSLRYKTNIRSFTSGLDLVKRLQPITFNWKQGGMHDLGLGAEDVAAVEPLLASYNEKGEVEGVKYDRIGVVLLNAVKEQQKQIENYEKRLEEQEKMLVALKALLCSSQPSATVCNEEKK